MPPKALFFGAIGTLVETSEIQRQAFNAAFAEAGLDWDWDRDTYRDMLQKPGGRQRIADFADAQGETVNVDELHQKKSAIFQNRLDEGVALRPRVAEVLSSAKQHGLKLAFVTTTSSENINAVIRATHGTLQRSDFDFVGSDDMVANGKPAPDIYEMALEHLMLKPSEVVAVEDTPSSAAAAVAAKIKTIAFRGDYAEGEFEGVADEVDILTPATVGLVEEEELNFAS
ncbi:HAD-IA family hydrolase [Litoreibacter roseus]|uniref:Protein CbbY n=1 Tax=Litoreibacter roseus TaxID=2601869 RepID=A0A6N6JHX8_9RHOB|nr:HAD-IA family hydrolase [Litoreibacter roseus]GFE65675.1 protein CbbY [Litoreibacter roseus]